MITGGAVVLGLVALPAFFVTVGDLVALANCSDECRAGYVFPVFLPILVGGLAIGAPLLAAGVYRNKIWRKWRHDHGMTVRPQFNRSRTAWTIGLELRF